MCLGVIAAMYRRIKSNSVHGAVYLRTELIFGTRQRRSSKSNLTVRRGGVIWKRTNFQFGPINMNIRMKHSRNEKKNEKSEHRPRSTCKKTENKTKNKYYPDRDSNPGR
jgi:hypothetical protein